MRTEPNPTNGGAAREVTLVIPARDAARTIEPCLDAALAVAARPGSRLARIVLVDDGSRDATREAAVARGIEILESGGRGAGAARNVGWRAATTELVWFVDSDCVAAPDALEILLPHLADPAVGGVGGSYAIAPDATLLERLIHEEIVTRHARMEGDVDFLATFNVLYRRDALAALEGFDERYLKGQDAEFAFRVLESGRRLRFDRGSLVRHFHADRLSKYLRVQRQQGYWRVALHLEHRGHGAGDSYSGLLDHLQPFAAAALAPAVLAAVAAPLAGVRGAALAAALAPLAFLIAFLLIAFLLAAQLPMARAMARREGAAMLWFVPLGAVRAVWRAAGLVHGVVDRTLGRGAIAARSLARRQAEGSATR
jgi:cellulose synthase/poly-beta-1,6-N-acetylglucosamine synthase-like glycosyltransferase